MRYPPRFLDEIRNRMSLSDVIGKRIKVTRAGREYKACCPFHHEKTPSFTINDDKQFYHCFGCGAHGDVIKFVTEHDNLSFNDAVEMLATEAGIEIPKPDPRAIAKEKQSRSLYDLMQLASQFFTHHLKQPSAQPIRDYIAERGLDEATAADFQIGYAPDNPETLIQSITQRGFSTQDLIKVGLAKPGKSGRAPYAFFRERVMFPVLDRQKRVIAFGGRALPDHMRAPSHSDFKPPKYLNSPDTPLFDKSRSLYGEDKARVAAREGLPVIVSEGYMDVIACHKAGFRGAVAPMGTALTEGQIQSLWQMIPNDNKNPILCFDGDRAGRQAAIRAVERFLPMLKAGHSARFAFLPDGEDPDSLITKHGAQYFETVLNSAINMLDFLWSIHIAAKDTTTPESRAAAIQSLKDAVAHIQDRDVQSHYKTLIDKRISDVFFARTNSPGKANAAGLRPAPPTQRPKMVLQNDLYERILLAALINHPIIFDEVEEYIAQIHFKNPTLERVKQNIIADFCSYDDLESLNGANYLDENGFMQEKGDILDNSLYVHASFADPTYDSQKQNALSIANQWIALWHDVQRQYEIIGKQNAKT